MRSKDFINETAAWQKKSGKNKNGGLNKKGVASYRREHPGSKLQTAVTTKPSKLKKGSKAAKRRKSFCARMKGMKKHRTGSKTKRDPNSRINKSLRKWHCESKEFNNNDYKIHDREHLDQYLIELGHLIIAAQKKDPEKFGMVAACVLDPDHNAVARTSMKVDDKWSHAERNAIDSYEKEYGEIPEGSILLTTLSPCDGPMSDRYEGSCTDYINSSPIKKVYCGYSDPSQHNEDFEFTIETTGNEDIQSICKKFADTFLGDENHPLNEGEEVDVIYIDGKPVVKFVSRPEAKAALEMLRKKYPNKKIEIKVEVREVKQRLDPKCWKGKHKEGTKIKGGIRVNNCVPNESVAETIDLGRNKYIVTYMNVLADKTYTALVPADDEYEARDRVNQAGGRGTLVQDVKLARGNEPTDREWKVYRNPNFAGGKQAGLYDREQGIEEGAPELLKAEMPLVRHIEQELIRHGYKKGSPEYDKHFERLLAYYRKFGNIDAINKGVAK
jgi:pyrimidine deaminase RibD-like protein